MSVKKRLSEIDVAKGIGILFVVFAHINYTPVLQTYIYSFHMPLFYILAGMMFRKEKYNSFKEFVKRRFLSLLCPYFFFYLVSMVVRFGIDFVLEGYSVALIGSYANYFLQMFIAERSAAVITAPLWFVTSLFFVECVYYFIAEWKGTAKGLACFVFACAGWYLNLRYGESENVLLIWNLGSSLFTIGFYALGNMFFRHIERAFVQIEEHRSKTVICVGGLLFFALILVPVALFNGKVTLGSRVLNNGFLFYVSGIIGTISILYASVLLKEIKFLQFCGRNSFAIMATHHLIRSIYRGAYSVLGLELYDNTKIVPSILPFIVVLALSIVSTLIYNKAKDLLKIG